MSRTAGTIRRRARTADGMGGSHAVGPPEVLAMAKSDLRFRGPAGWRGRPCTLPCLAPVACSQASELPSDMPGPGHSPVQLPDSRNGCFAAPGDFGPKQLCRSAGLQRPSATTSQTICWLHWRGRGRILYLRESGTADALSREYITVMGEQGRFCRRLRFGLRDGGVRDRRAAK
jgi:hypothetical protein